MKRSCVVFSISRLAAFRASLSLTLALWALFSIGVASAQEVDSDVSMVLGTGDAGLSLRAGPGTEYPRLQVLPERTLVRVLEPANGPSDWREVEVTGAAGLTGWVNARYLVRPDQARAPAAPESPPPGSRVITATIVGYANGADGGAVGFRTASGTRTHWGTVAADTRLYPFGTRVMIEGFDDVVFVVEDTGSAVRGNVFDVWFPDLDAARKFGTQQRRVTILP